MQSSEQEQLNAIFAVESLRAGVPTRVSTRELPDLRKEITEKIRADLAEFDNHRYPMGRIVWGQYGQGKTHVLTTAEHVALDMGFAVSRVSLSREVSCHNLFKFYAKVAPCIKTPDFTTEGIRGALNRKMSSDRPDVNSIDVGRYANPLPTIVFEDYFHTTGEEQDKLYGDLTGVRIPMPDLKRIHRASREENFPRIEAFKASMHAGAYFGLMADIVMLCGYKGWVILIDEAELVGRLGKVSRLMAYRNLYWLLNGSGQMKYPVYTLAAAATRLQDDLWYGAKNDDTTIMPKLAEQKFGRDAKFEIEDFFEKALGTDSLQVSPVTGQELVKLIDSIAQIHGKAYQWLPVLDSADLIRRIGAETVRTYIRAALETLDLSYLYHEKPLLEVEDLHEQKLEEDTDFFSDAGLEQ